jgi:hypothetical protein
MAHDGWFDVTKDKPCPVCGRPDWCSLGAKWVHCMRVQSTRSCKGGGWLHHADAQHDLPPATETTRRLSDAEMRAKWEPVAMEAAKVGRSFLPALAQTLGVTELALAKLHVGYLELQGSWCWTFPERNADGWVVGIVRRLQTPRNGKNKLCAKGSRHGLTYHPAWACPPGPIWLVEGGSDVAAGITLGIAVVGRPSCTGGIRYLAELLAPHRDRRIIVLGENDRKAPLHLRQLVPPHDPHCRCCLRCAPGLAGAKQTAQALALALGRRVEWRLPPKGIKDLRDLVRGLSPLERVRYANSFRDGVIPTPAAQNRQTHPRGARVDAGAHGD